MNLNCFFGIELRPDGSAVTPVIPPKSKLVLTHCSITSIYNANSSSATTTTTNKSSSAVKKSSGGASSPGSSSSSSPTTTKGSPSPAVNIDTAEGSRLLDGAVTLYVQGNGIPKQFAVCTLSLLQGVTYAPLELIFNKQAILTLRRSSGGAVGPDVEYPSVHLTGYYEEDRDDEDEEEEDEEEMDEEDEEEGRGNHSAKEMAKKRRRK